MSDYAFIRARMMNLIKEDSISKEDFIKEVESTIGVAGSVKGECDSIIKQMSNVEFAMLVSRIRDKLRKKKVLAPMPAGVA